MDKNEKLQNSTNHYALIANSNLNEGLRPRLSSAEIFGTAREVVIEHAGEEYRLRLTRQNKLILTK